MSLINRRKFLLSGSAAVGACIFCPHQLGAADAPAAKGPVDLGPLAELPKDPISAKWARTHGLFLVRNGNRLHAMSTICTHKEVELVARGRQVKCPQHGSIFAIDGKPSKAPAQKPLPRFAIRLDERGHVIVDPSRRFEAVQWSDPQSYLEI